MKIYLLIIFCLLFCDLAKAEQDNLMAGYDLGKIVITPSKIEESYEEQCQNISIISQDDIADYGIMHAADVLDWLPSVDIVRYGSVGAARNIRVRGSSSNQVLTLIDGIPLNTPRDGVTDFNEISLSNIERIEVLRGPKSSGYGSSAMGGVINVITKSGTEKMQTNLSTKFGSFSTKQVLFNHGYKIRDFDYFIAYDYLISHGHRENSEYLSNNINLKFGYQIDNFNHLSFSSGYFKSKLGIPGTISVPSLTNQQESFDKHYNLTYKGSFFENQKHTLKLFQRIDRLEVIDSSTSAYKDTHTSKIFGVDSYYWQELTDKVDLAAGYAYQDNLLNSSTTGKRKYNFKAIYSNLGLNLLDWFSLNGSLRWDDYSNFGDKLSPSGGLNWWLCDTTKLHLLYGRAFRAPTFNDLWWPATAWAQGNPNLTPETSWSGEVGVTNDYFSFLRLDLTFFKTRYEDLINWAEDDNKIWKPTNVGTAKTQGFEIEADYSIASKLNANFSYSYIESKDLTTKKWLVYRPRHLYKLKLKYSPISKLDLGLIARYKTKVLTDTSNLTSLKQYFLLNLNSSYKLNKAWELFFDIKNLFDRDYQEKRDYSLPGRTFYGGAKVKF